MQDAVASHIYRLTLQLFYIQIQLFLFCTVGADINPVLVLSMR